jgi:hypothetical protein
MSVRERLVTALKSILSELKCTYDFSDDYNMVMVESSEGKKGKINLHPLLAKYSTSPDIVTALLRQNISSGAFYHSDGIPETSLFSIRLKPLSYFAQAPLQGAIAIRHVPGLHELAYAVTIKKSESMQQFVTLSMCVAWNADPEVLFEVALRNLRQAFLKSSPMMRRKSEPDVLMIDTRDSNDAARVLLLEELAKVDVPGDVVVVPAAQSLVFVTGSRSALGCAFLSLATVDVANNPKQAPHLLHPHPLRVVRSATGAWSYAKYEPQPHEFHVLTTIEQLRERERATAVEV